jgi:hypothetical protein
VSDSQFSVPCTEPMGKPGQLAFGEWNADGTLKVTFGNGFELWPIRSSGLRLSESKSWAWVAEAAEFIAVKMPRNLQGSKN